MEEAKKNLELIEKYFSDLSETQRSQFLRLGGLYEEWNAAINVLSRKDMGNLYEKHVLHSLSIAAVFSLSGKNILDLGTGGGFPGIPLAIFFPDANFHLVDSIGKKLQVVKAVAEALDLKNISTEHTRVEQIRNRKFDTVVSRAVAPLRELWNWSKPLINKDPNRKSSMQHSNGLICLKGGDLAQEISESGCRPFAVEISSIFSEEHFREKFLLFVPR